MITRDYIIARMSQLSKTSNEWENSNLVLLNGEIGIEQDTGLIKIGDGVTDWINLPYQYGLDIEYQAGTGIVITENREIQAALQYEEVVL